MAPSLKQALSGGSAERLREVIERNRLMDPLPDGSPSPLVTMVHVGLKTLASMVDDPPEEGAPPRSDCNDLDPPAPRDTNRTCEARRIIRTFVREGKGLEALRHIDPLIAALLDYVAGRAPWTEPHYQAAAVIGATCTKAYCSTLDMLDLISGLLSFLEPTQAEPRRPLNLLAQLNAVLQHPQARTVIDFSVEKMGEAEVVAFSRLLLDNVMNLPTNPAEFQLAYHRDIEVQLNTLLTKLGLGRDDPKYRDLRLALDGLVGSHESAGVPHGSARPLLFDLLDPARRDPVLAPMQRLIHCMNVNDPHSAMTKMVYALFFESRAIDIAGLMASLEELARIDERVSLLTFGKRTVEMIRQDEAGIDASRRLCSIIFDTARVDVISKGELEFGFGFACDGPGQLEVLVNGARLAPESYVLKLNSNQRVSPGGTVSFGARSAPPLGAAVTLRGVGFVPNAELIVPVTAELFTQGVVSEVLCVTDTLLFGCSGGEQPSCAPAP